MYSRMKCRGRLPAFASPAFASTGSFKSAVSRGGQGVGYAVDNGAAAATSGGVQAGDRFESRRIKALPPGGQGSRIDPVIQFLFA